MSTKTTFKRIALVAVAALGLGILSVAPSSATVSANTLSLNGSTTSSPTVTAVVGETTTAITVVVQYTPSATSDTQVVTIVEPSSAAATYAANTAGSRLVPTTDSISATIAYGSDSKTMVITPGLANAVTKATFSFTVVKTANAGTFSYTVHVRDSVNANVLSLAAVVTVTAADTSVDATKSNMYINQALVSNTLFTRADSALTVSAGQDAALALATPVARAYMGVVFNNLAGDSVNATTGTNVNGTVVVKITSGPGFLSKNGDASTNLRQVSVVRGDTITVWSDGASGVATITGYVGTTPLTETAKTITFYGKATSFVATANAVTAAGWNLSALAADTVLSGTAILTFLAKDSSSLAVPSASQNRNSAFYVFSSDTKVVRSTASATAAYGTCTAPTTVANIAAGKWSCDMLVIDSGTVTLTVADSLTVASSLYTANVITATIAGAAFTGTLDFGTLAGVSKNAYAPGESAMMTVTCKDRAGRTCGQPSTTGVSIDPFTWGTLSQNKQFWIGATTSTTGQISTGTATLATVQSWMAAGSTFMGGTETVVVNMPLTTGDLTINGYTSYDSSTSNVVISKTLTITDVAVTAAKDASDAATDAALEATDAAYAATDAANIAAEAADAATAAAEAATEAANAAKESADAATAAVEELATSVAKLMAALQAQITTLAKVVAKIAVKVKA